MLSPLVQAVMTPTLDVSRPMPAAAHGIHRKRHVRSPYPHRKATRPGIYPERNRLTLPSHLLLFGLRLTSPRPPYMKDFSCKKRVRHSSISRLCAPTRVEL